MEGPREELVDLSATGRAAEAAAHQWGLELGAPFSLSRFSYVAPAGAHAVLKVPWEGDDESLHEPEALELWDGDGAVLLLRRSGRALLEERALPGDDISDLPDDEALAVAVDLGSRLWRRAHDPFRWVGDNVPRWLDDAEGAGEQGSELVPLARELLAVLEPGRDYVVHGDFHHHNVLRHGGRFVAIDPKPYLADREYDVYPWLHNPLPYRMTDRGRTENRIAAFVAAGLDDFKIRAWAVIRGSYLIGDSEEAAVLSSLVR
jgi:streptomycin 6-kinase